ncbi:hypothetical protein R6Q59_030772 [Mikania micrantha]
METHHRQPPSTAVGFNLNHHHEPHFTKEHMFEKPLTPSDVGKLNRLVIPKQHAEKYFPMADQQKGLVLSFEDESGKLWRFRYSYWTSSQSYVLTKGWSRYVKEKRLDAGDIVLFQRHVADGQRMFIGWRPRVSVPDRNRPVSGGDAPIDYSSHHPHPPAHLSLPYQPSCLNAVEIYENVDTYQRGEVATRRVRLFGVNLECQGNSEPSNPYGSSHGGQSDHQYDIGSNILHHNMHDEIPPT